MQRLNLPPAHLKIRQRENRDYVFDRLRKQFVRLTPEEFVRQHFVNYLIEYKKYPEGLLANEVCIELGKLNRRCDTVLYDRFLQARMIIEYKAPAVAIDRNVFDQIVRYNMSLQVAWLIVSNGLQHFCCYIDKEKQEYFFLKDIPPYDKLKN
jgi:hypothetical protein